MALITTTKGLMDESELRRVDGAVDAILIYNSSTAGSPAVSVHTFGTQNVTAGTFTLTMPTNYGTTGLIRFGT